MQYDNLHNIVSKKQHVEQSNIIFNGTLKAGYDLAYNYANNPFQISTLEDENYRTEGNAEKDKIINEHIYRYDANGNLIYVNTPRWAKRLSLRPVKSKRSRLQQNGVLYVI